MEERHCYASRLSINISQAGLQYMRSSLIIELEETMFLPKTVPAEAEKKVRLVSALRYALANMPCRHGHQHST